ncbi:MAG: tetratricopeptide repeat protein [Gammaproteobacteria bacterium]|nr:tetratricopeptide repeat protein [Gammaproteobacteria bacterium]
MIRVLVFLLLSAIAGVTTAVDWESPTDLKYKDKNPELYREFDQARNILDSWRGERAKLSQAQQLLASVIKTDAIYAPAYRELGRLYIMVGYKNRDNYDPRSLSPAEAAIRKSIEIEPGYADAYVLLGHLYTNMKQYDQARSALQKGESLGTKSPWIQLNWAALLEKQGEFEAAVKRYKVVVDSNTPNKKAYGAALEGLIKYYIVKDDLEAADAWYKRQLVYEPSNAWAWGNYAGFLLCRRNDVDGAIKNGEKALSIMNYGIGRFTLACALYTKWAQEMQKGNTGSATQAVFERAYELYPDTDAVIASTVQKESTRVTAVQLEKYMQTRATIR